MSEQLEQWQEKIDSLSLRERVLVLLVSAAAIVMLLQVMLIDPVVKQRTAIKQQLHQLSEDVRRQSNEKVLLDAQLAAGINRESIKRHRQLLAMREKLDKRIEESVVAMIPPKLMPRVLEDILLQDDNLKLLSLEDRPAVSLIEQSSDKQSQSDDNKADQASNADSKKQALYKHAFVLQLQGTYPATIAYFEKLSTLPWRFYWDGLLYQVTEYPYATITLEVHTVSMSEEWLGV